MLKTKLLHSFSCQNLVCCCCHRTMQLRMDYYIITFASEPLSISCREKMLACRAEHIHIHCLPLFRAEKKSHILSVSLIVGHHFTIIDSPSHNNEAKHSRHASSSASLLSSGERRIMKRKHSAKKLELLGPESTYLLSNWLEEQRTLNRNIFIKRVMRAAMPHDPGLIPDAEKTKMDDNEEKPSIRFGRLSLFGSRLYASSVDDYAYFHTDICVWKPFEN